MNQVGPDFNATHSSGSRDTMSLTRTSNGSIWTRLADRAALTRIHRILGSPTHLAPAVISPVALLAIVCSAVLATPQVLSADDVVPSDVPQHIEVHLDHVIRPGTGIVLHLETAGGAVSASRATSPFWNYKSKYMIQAFGNHHSFEVDTSGLTLSRTHLRGQIKTTVADHSKRDTKELTLTLDCSVSANGVVSGTWTAGDTHGPAEGARRLATNAEGVKHVSLYVVTGERTSRLILLTFSNDGELTNIEARSGRTQTYISDPKHPVVVADADGKLVTLYQTRFARKLERIPAGATKGTASLEENRLALDITIQPSDKETRIAGELAVIGNMASGALTVTGSDGKHSTQSALGRIGVGGKPIALEAATPPTQGSVKDRVLAHARLLMRSSDNAAFRSDEPLLWVNDSGTKNYDNITQNSYGAIVAASLVHRLSNDPTERMNARIVARRAANFLTAHRVLGAVDTPFYYKNGYWLTIWQAWAYLEMAVLTGDAAYLGEAKKYADILKKYQQPSGTWTWIGRDGKIGESFRRHDRDVDNSDLACGDYLLFLGRLRKQFGVNDYADVEAKALAWMTEAIADPQPAFWTERGNYLPLGSGPKAYVEAMNPTAMLLYLQRYADDPDLKTQARLNEAIQKHFIFTARKVYGKPKLNTTLPEDMTLVITGHVPRGCESYFPNLAATARWGLSHALSGNRDQAETITTSVLAAQNKKTGRIHPWGLTGRRHVDDCSGGYFSYTCYQAEIGLRLLQIDEALRIRDGGVRP